jgi:photosystem II stability/assembly factor-like uncharacterized protein
MFTSWRTLTVVVSLMIAGAVWAAEQTPVSVDVLAQLSPWRQYYGQRESWPRGYGWKPFKRFEWEMLQRSYRDGTIPAGGYWTAMEQRARMPRVTLDETWTNLGPYNHGGRTRVLRWDPDNTNIMYAGAVGGGLWRSVDAGQNWEPFTDQLPNLAVGSFEIDPSNSQIMYLGTGEGYFNADAIMGLGLLKTTDGGQSWQQTGMNFNYSSGTSVLQIDIDPRDGNIVLASTVNGLRRSINGGTSFTNVLLGDINALERDPQNPDVLLAGAGNAFGDGTNGIYRSENNGVTWTRMTDGLPSSTQFGRAVLAFYPANTQIVYAGICGTFSNNNSQMLGIFRSVDNGLTWMQMSQAGTNHYSQQGWYDMAIVVKPNQSNVIFSAGLDVHRSNNSGLLWSQLSWWFYAYGDPNFVHADNHGLYFHPDDPNQIWCVTDGGIFKSADLGNNWQEMNNGFATFQYYAMGNATLDTTLCYGGTQDNGTSEYVGNPSWDEVFGGDGGYSVVDYTDDNTVYAEYQNGNRFRSDNGAHAFSDINPGITGTGAWVTPMALDPFDHLTVYTTTAGGDGQVWKSPNQGRNSQWATLGQSLGGSLQVLGLSPVRRARVYVGTNSSIYRSDDGGDFVSASNGLPGSWITRVVPDPYNPDLVYATVSGFGTGHVWRSLNAGANWANISGNLPDVPFADVVVDLNNPQILYAGSDIGAYYSENGGLTWSIYGEGLPAVRIDDMEMQTATGVLRVGTHGRGMWEIPTGAAAISMFYPNGGETLSPGDVIDVRWGGSSFGGNVRLELNRDYPAGTWETIVNPTPNDGVQSWTVTGPASDHVRFRIVHLTMPDQADTSNADTRIHLPSMTVLWPQGGETVLSGVRDTIRFARTLTPEAVRVELNRDYPSGAWEEIAANITLDYAIWQVQLPATTHGRIRVVSQTRPEVIGVSAADFTLRAPQMQVISPAGGEQLVIGAPVTIGWDAAEHRDRVRLHLNRDYPNGTWELIASTTPNDGLYNWSPTGPESSHCRVRLTAIFDPATYVDSPGDFSITASAAHDGGQLPTSYRVSEPYPNPFNPSTQITLELPSATRVTAHVLNQLGQQVSTLTDDEYSAGVHTLTFDGSELSSGLYFLRLTAYGETRMIKLTLVK